ncbi:GTP pyrophosphokinase, partial [Paeniclostridium sordellii]|nr:GTP pyrophosphokinase [Paeniclostridium sordellii]
EIDHQLRYSHKKIPEVLAQNLMLLNRKAGSSDEMASLINVLSKSMEDAKKEYEEKLREKDKEIENLLKLVNEKDKK